jgi:adenine phosphoribosyltransferase
MDAELDELARLVRDVPDFPKPGVVFKDLTPVLASPHGLRRLSDRLALGLGSREVDVIVAPESRGFLFGAALAQHLGVGLALVRKPGKLPWRTTKHEYELEYGTDCLEIHIDAVLPGQRVLLVDDVLATGGTAHAALELAREHGGIVVGASFVIELSFLAGRDKLPGVQIDSVWMY